MQQLSKQDHYDFGLRSMVALLRYAGRKRRDHPDLPEEQIVYLAMADMNIAKLTSDDLPLFTSIMSDILPNVDIPHIDYDEMIGAMQETFKELNVQVSVWKRLDWTRTIWPVLLCILANPDCYYQSDPTIRN